jgi:hypothetical protein
MSRPSAATRQGWQQELSALAAQGRPANTADVINAVFRLARENPRQADALSYRYWGCSVAKLQQDVAAGDLDRLAVIVETPYQDVGLALDPPVSRTAATNLATRGFTRMLSIMATFL